MENLLLLLATTMLLRRPETENRFQRYFIDTTGCSLQFPSDFSSLDKSRTADGDTLYFKECSDGEALYGMILINQADTTDDADGLLFEFMLSLHDSFSIKHQTGLKFEGVDTANGYIRSYSDFWQDADGTDWKAKGYTDGRSLVVLYVKNINEVPVERQDFFLDSFEFPKS